MRRVYEEKPTSFKFLSLNNILSLIRYMMPMSNFQHLLKKVCWSVTPPHHPPQKKKKNKQTKQWRYAGPLMAHLKQTTLYQHSLWQVTHQRYQLGISYLWEFGPLHILGIDASPWHYVIYSHRDWYELAVSLNLLKTVFKPSSLPPELRLLFI